MDNYNVQITFDDGRTVVYDNEKHYFYNLMINLMLASKTGKIRYFFRCMGSVLKIIFNTQIQCVGIGEKEANKKFESFSDKRSGNDGY